MRLLQSSAEQGRAHANQLIAARDRLAVINMLDRVNMSNLRLLQSASLPLTKIGPRRGRLAAFGILFGIAVGLMGLFVGRSLDRRVREPRDLFVSTSTKTVCLVPDVSRRTAQFARSKGRVVP